MQAPTRLPSAAPRPTLRPARRSAGRYEPPRRAPPVASAVPRPSALYVHGRYAFKAAVTTSSAARTAARAGLVRRRASRTRPAELSSPRRGPSGRGESNPRFWLGKPTSCHWTTPAERDEDTDPAEYPEGHARPRLLARHDRRRAARRPARLRAHDDRHRHDARRRDGRGRACRAADRGPPAGARRRRRRLARRLPGQGRARQRLGVLVRALPRRAAADPEGAQDAVRAAAAPCSGST